MLPSSTISFSKQSLASSVTYIRSCSSSSSKWSLLAAHTHTSILVGVRGNWSRKNNNNKMKSESFSWCARPPSRLQRTRDFSSNVQLMTGEIEKKKKKGMRSVVVRSYPYAVPFLERDFVYVMWCMGMPLDRIIETERFLTIFHLTVITGIFFMVDLIPYPYNVDHIWTVSKWTRAEQKTTPSFTTN